ncbi:flagellar filament capping protein FliD [Conexibacter arvalis]|uniref:Flagellar hook-associated protein 2 n=1 Tax=Conexibacter arvalis TaxID=912552 RepID=A0A840I822_9ACTN|nr:flagellar filament capping protein FliD [Conexibacter arvalis]MBB4661016.1 flagellar hook-associated protein 2 [Conexibacter arvalis]
MSTWSVSGLASGLPTADILAQMMAIEKRPRMLLDTKQTLIEARQQLLRDFQTKLRAVQTAAADLRSVALWAQTQAVESSDPTKVAATSTSGAGVGGYQIEVSQLANAAQRTFAFTSPTADGEIVIDGHATRVTAGMTAQEFATAFNTDRDATVYAAAIDDGTIVFSSRRTGAVDSFIDVGPNGSLVEDETKARAGRDAIFTVDGELRRSSENVVRDAIAGVTLTLRGITSASGPVTVSVGAPGANTEAIQRKLQAFVDAYNGALDAIRSKLDEKSVPDERTQQDIKNGVPDRRTAAQLKAGVLFGDRQLSSLLTEMRQLIYTPLSGLPEEMNSLADLGISTGAASSSTSRDALAGRLTLDVEKLTTALTNDPNGVRDLLAGVDNVGGWARGFEAAIDTAVRADGVLHTRIDGADEELKHLKAQMTQMDARLSVRERSLQAMFTALEVALAKSQQQSQWLSGQLASLGA